MTDSVESAFQRSKLYRLFSYCFFYPDKELLQFLKSGECLRELETALRAYTRGVGMADMEGLLGELKKIARERELILDEHIRFITLKSSSPPYETDYYRSALAVFSAEDMADVAGFYRSFGMDFHMERPDYIATELEFMYLACLREAEAMNGEESEKAALCRTIEKKFLEEHLGRWLTAFSEALATAGSRFYGPLAALLADWLDLECRYLDAAPQKVTPGDLAVEEGDDPVPLCEVNKE